MFCQKCGSQIPDGTNFCPKCGNPIQGAPQQQAYSQVPPQQQAYSQVPPQQQGYNQVPPQQQPPFYQPPQPAPQQPKSKNTGVVVAIIVAVIVVIGIVVGVLFATGTIGGSKDDSDTKEKTSQTADSDDDSATSTTEATTFAPASTDDAQEYAKTWINSMLDGDTNAAKASMPSYLDGYLTDDDWDEIMASWDIDLSTLDGYDYEFITSVTEEVSQADIETYVATLNDAGVAVTTDDISAITVLDVDLTVTEPTSGQSQTVDVFDNLPIVYSNGKYAVDYYLLVEAMDSVD